MDQNGVIITTTTTTASSSSSLLYNTEILSGYKDWISFRDAIQERNLVYATALDRWNGYRAAVKEYEMIKFLHHHNNNHHHHHHYHNDNQESSSVKRCQNVDGNTCDGNGDDCDCGDDEAIDDGDGYESISVPEPPPPHISVTEVLTLPPEPLIICPYARLRPPRFGIDVGLTRLSLPSLHPYHLPRLLGLGLKLFHKGESDIDAVTEEKTTSKIGMFGDQSWSWLFSFLRFSYLFRHHASGSALPYHHRGRNTRHKNSLTPRLHRNAIYVNADEVRIECDRCVIEIGSGTHLAFGPSAKNLRVSGVTFTGATSSSLVFHENGADAEFEDCYWVKNIGAGSNGAVADMNSTRYVIMVKVK